MATLVSSPSVSHLGVPLSESTFNVCQSPEQNTTPNRQSSFQPSTQSESGDLCKAIEGAEIALHKISDCFDM